FLPNLRHSLPIRERDAQSTSAQANQSTITGSQNASLSGARLPESVELTLPVAWSAIWAAEAEAMEPLEVAITIIFDALLLVFMVKLFFAMFQMKLVVILFYLVILLFAMAFSGRAPSSF
ncbi:unnamed protein product, partial [Urochloa humidicola]